jgi:hypothetical protein
MVDLSHLRNNRKVITATLAGVALVAISVGVGVGVTRGKKGGAGDPPIDADSSHIVTDNGAEPLLADKESFLRADGFTDILDEIPEVEEEEVEEEERTPRVPVDYANTWGGSEWGSSWGGNSKCGSWSGSTGKSGKSGSLWGSGKSGKSGSGRRQCKFFPLPLTISLFDYAWSSLTLYTR